MEQCSVDIAKDLFFRLRCQRTQTSFLSSFRQSRPLALPCLPKKSVLPWYFACPSVLRALRAYGLRPSNVCTARFRWICAQTRTDRLVMNCHQAAILYRRYAPIPRRSSDYCRIAAYKRFTWYNTWISIYL